MICFIQEANFHTIDKQLLIQLNSHVVHNSIQYNGPLQKRERTGKEYGRFKTKIFK